VSNCISSEFELYEPMRKWLQQHIEDTYNGYRIETFDAHSQQLDRVLAGLGIVNELAVGVGIQIDVLGIARKNEIVKLFFIEAKKTALNLRDLGQLLIYCKLIDPEEAYLFTSAELGSLDKLIRIHGREDLLDYGNKKTIKKIKIAKWDINANSPNILDMFPKI